MVAGTMRASTIALYEYMVKRGGWVSIRQVFNDFPTNTPSKRLSELYQAGLIEKRRGAANPKYTLYRAKEGS